MIRRDSSMRIEFDEKAAPFRHIDMSLETYLSMTEKSMKAPVAERLEELLKLLRAYADAAARKAAAA